MAYDFNGSTSRINYGSPSYLDDLTNFTLSAIITIDNFTSNTEVGRIIDKSQMALHVDNTSGAQSLVNAIVYSTTNLQVRAANSSLATGTRTHVASVYRNGTTAGTDLELFINGVEPSYALSQNAVGTRTSDAASEFCVGDRAAGLRNFDGRISEVAVWNAELNADEIVSLSKGFKPSRIRPQSLVFYAPLVRSARDLKNATSSTETSTAVSAHPRVY